ncbi:MAG: adhesin [Methanobrevibacter sp.]|uniref:adhesin n=1 Tax=Methanobrevibacter sp. TaxID=66852 RepID=UPI0025E1A874|nr:adhesin [Methanobrevibacter sp.]MBQ6099112.1 adhesin [Methanobrevibacter sp.]
MKIKFTIIDYIIIILVICAVAFAFIHITSDDSSNIQKTAFDSSTLNKLPETYLNYYKDGKVVKATVEGFNSSTGEEVTVNGTVKWVDEGSSVRVLIETANGTYITGLYKNTPYADIYIKTISIESDNSVYENLTEFKIKPQNITSLNDLNRNLSNSDYEISTTITTDSIDTKKIQEIENKLLSDNKRVSIKSSNSELTNQIIISKANSQNLDAGNSILGSINGITDEITLRVYNCSDSELNNIKNSYEVTNIRNF